MDGAGHRLVHFPLPAVAHPVFRHRGHPGLLGEEPRDADGGRAHHGDGCRPVVGKLGRSPAPGSLGVGVPDPSGHGSVCGGLVCARGLVEDRSRFRARGLHEHPGGLRSHRHGDDHADPRVIPGGGDLPRHPRGWLDGDKGRGQPPLTNHRYCSELVPLWILPIQRTKN